MTVSQGFLNHCTQVGAAGGSVSTIGMSHQDACATNSSVLAGRS